MKIDIVNVKADKFLTNDRNIINNIKILANVRYFCYSQLIAIIEA